MLSLVAILAVAQQWGWRQQMLVMLYLTLQTANEQQLMQPRAVMWRLEPLYMAASYQSNGTLFRMPPPATLFSMSPWR